MEFGSFSDEWDSAVTLSGGTLTSDPVEAGRPTDFTLAGATPVSTTEVVVLTRN